MKSKSYSQLLKVNHVACLALAKLFRDKGGGEHAQFLAMAARYRVILLAIKN